MLLTFPLLLVAHATPVQLARKFELGEKDEYRVTAEVRAQERAGNEDTFIPENVTFSYGFTTQVTKLKPDGIVDMLYRRPTFTIDQDEDFDSGPTKTVQPVNLKVLLTVSPINHILDEKRLSAAGSQSSPVAGSWIAGEPALAAKQLGPFMAYIRELHRLALFIGSLDTGMDFNPKLPLDRVSVGDTWKETVSYEPQKIEGDKNGGEEVQRLDYVFTYKGPMVSQGKQVQRVEATLAFSTDLGEFLNQLLHATADQTHLQKIPLNFRGTIDFDLDPKTLRTIHAEAHSEGGFQIWVTGVSSRPFVEQTFKGQTTEDLVRVGTAKP